MRMSMTGVKPSHLLLWTMNKDQTERGRNGEGEAREIEASKLPVLLGNSLPAQSRDRPTTIPGTTKTINHDDYFLLSLPAYPYPVRNTQY